MSTLFFSSPLGAVKSHRRSTTGGGGTAGILTGVAVSQIVSAVAGWPILLSPTAIVGGFVFLAAVGVFFGYYPARKAAMLDPIEALRYE